MESQGDRAPTNPPVCEECEASPSKYKCPGCSMRSCSLPCVKAHKQRTGCTGKRSQTQFVPLSQFDDNLLLSDYNLLEEVKRVAESAQRTRTKLCGVNENTNLCSIIENHLKTGPWNHQLRQFCEEQLDCLKFFIRKYPKGSVSPFRELDVRASIKQQFSSLVILEYPVIYVSLPSHSSDFDVVKDTNPVTEKPELKDSESNPSPIGAPFKEEEIEDDNNSSDPRVFELMKHVSSSPMPRSPHYNLRTEKEVDNSSECPLFSRVATSNWSHSTSNSNEAGVSQMMDFDFDQGLIDSYSELIAQINPDDFLDLEFEFAEELDAEGRRELSDLRAYLSADEELEEGEILE